MASRGQPTKFTPDKAKEIFDRIADGEAARAVAGSVGLTNSAFWVWIDSKPDYQEQYAISKQRAMEKMADEILSISDDSTGDEKFITDSNGKVIPVCNTEFVQRSKLRVDTRKWLMSKLAPKKYGERSTTELVGKDGKDLPITFVIGTKEIKKIEE
jgi:hypothetical protein